MATKNDVLKLGIDAIEGRVTGEFSKSDLGAGFREGLIELNGGSTVLDPRTFHRGTELFAVIEEILPHVVNEGLKGDEFFMNLVDYRNLAEGDMNEFWTEDNSLFLVGNIAEGSQAVRRQRLNAGSKLSLPVQLKAIRVYEEMRRLMAGRVDFNTLVERVGASMTQHNRNEIYKVFAGVTAATAGLSETYVRTGSFSEDELLDLIAHVEASTGKAATVFGTKKALRKIETAIQSDEARSDMYNMGYYGRFNGTPLVSVKQLHKIGTDEFMMDDNKLYVIAAEDKPFKFVTEGDGLLIERASIENADLTQEYLYAERNGCGAIFNEKMGIYTLA